MELGRALRSRVNLAGKVRIFELAKEVGLTSKELMALFNGRLGGVFEAKNQLSVVPGPDRRSGAQRAAQASAAKPPAAGRRRAPAAPLPRRPSLLPQSRAAAKSRRRRPRRRRPVARRRSARLRPRAPRAPSLDPPTRLRRHPRLRRRLAEARRRRISRPSKLPRLAGRRRRATAGLAEPIFQLRPVPAGQSSIRRQAPPADATAASASPGPRTGIPGRPGVAPRPGQGMPGQGGKAPAPRRAAPPRPGRSRRRAVPPATARSGR